MEFIPAMRMSEQQKMFPIISIGGVLVFQTWIPQMAYGNTTQPGDIPALARAAAVISVQIAIYSRE